MNTMVRTQISLPKDQKAELERITLWQNVSMSEAVRRALEDYIKQEKQKRKERLALINSLAGSLAKSKTWKGIDAVKWQREIRHEKGI